MHSVLYLRVTHCSKIKTTIIIKARNLLKGPKFYPCCPLPFHTMKKTFKLQTLEVWRKAQS